MTAVTAPVVAVQGGAVGRNVGALNFATGAHVGFTLNTLGSSVCFTLCNWKIDILKRNGRSGDPGEKLICYLQSMEV